MTKADFRCERIVLAFISEHGIGLAPLKGCVAFKPAVRNMSQLASSRVGNAHGCILNFMYHLNLLHLQNDMRHGPEGVALESERILLDPGRMTPVLKNQLVRRLKHLKSSGIPQRWPEP